MDWEAAERRHDPATVEGRLWAGLQRLIAARRATRAIHVQGVDRADLDRQRPRLRALPRAGGRARCSSSANFTADPQPMSLGACPRARLRAHRGGFTNPTAAPAEAYHDFIVLAPYQHLWFHA